MASDLRPLLEAIARGRDPRLMKTMDDRPILDPEVVKAHQGAFRAWLAFARTPARGRHTGEPLAAPAALLTPLP